MPRGIGYGFGPYVPERYDDSGQDRISDLMLRGGDIRAQGSLASGQAWGGMLGNLGNIAGTAVQQIGQEKAEKSKAEEEKNRIEGFSQFIASEWDGDPRRLMAVSLETFGPEQGFPAAEAVMRFSMMGQEDPQEAVKSLGVTLGLLEKLPEELVELNWPLMMRASAPALTTLGLDPSTLPQDYSPEALQVATNLGKVIRGESGPELLEGGPFYSPDTGEWFTPPETPKPDSRGFEARTADAVQVGDAGALERLLGGERAFSAAGRAPQAPTAPKPLASAPQEWQTVVTRAAFKDAALRGILAEQVDALLASGDTEQAGEVVRQVAMEGESVDDKRMITGRMETIAALNDIQDMLDQLEADGVDTGVFLGGWEKGFRKLGETTDTRVAELVTRLRSTVLLYRRAMTGVAFNPQEAAEYEALFPDFSNEPPTNKAIIRGLLRSMAANDETYWTRKLGAGGARLVGALRDQEGPNPFRSNQKKNPFR